MECEKHSECVCVCVCVRERERERERELRGGGLDFCVVMITFKRLRFLVSVKYAE